MIDFEKDQEEVLTRTKEIKSLSDQVLKLRTLEDEFKTDEELFEIHCWSCKGGDHTGGGWSG